MRNIREKEKHTYVSNIFYKESECVDLKERNRKQMHDQLKRRYKSEKNLNLK